MIRNRIRDVRRLRPSDILQFWHSIHNVELILLINITFARTNRSKNKQIQLDMFFIWMNLKFHVLDFTESEKDKADLMTRCPLALSSKLFHFFNSNPALFTFWTECINQSTVISQRNKGIISLTFQLHICTLIFFPCLTTKLSPNENYFLASHFPVLKIQFKN
jgi:hypothetical protein